MPKGYTEKEVIKIINHIVGKFAKRFLFPPHSINDMKQQGWIFALEGLRNYDEERPLYKFLHVHIRNRFSRFLRDKFSRSEAPCECDCERRKKWAARQARRRQINSMQLIEAPDSLLDKGRDPVVERAEVDEMFDIIDRNLPSSMRGDYRRMMDGVQLTKQKRENLKVVIREILEEVGYGR